MRLIAALQDWLDEERDRLPLWLPVFMGAGVAAYYGLRFEPPWWVGAAVALPLVLAACAFRRARLLLAPLAAVTLGFSSGQMATLRAPPIETSLPGKATQLSGTVAAVETLPEGRRIMVAPAFLDGRPLRRSVRIRMRATDNSPLQAGDAVMVKALVRPPSMPAYPSAWDLQRDAFYSGLGASGFALGAVERTAVAQPAAPLRAVQWLRETIAGRITAVIPGAAGTVSVTLLTGASMSIPEADHAAFRDSGLAHLLAVAGLHIGIVMGFALAVSRLGLALSERASLFWPTKKLAAFCAVAAGGAYMVLTGMHVPIVRSFLMACLLTVAMLADRRPLSTRGLALAGMILMLIAPQELPGVSFQMSFSAVLALISGYEALRPWLRRLHGSGWQRQVGTHLAALALTSALAGTASAPYGAYHFGHVQVYFILANMVAVPLTAFWVMPAGLIALLLMPLHLEALALVPMGWGAELVLRVARATAALPAATFDVPHMPLWGLCVVSLGLAWLGLWQGRRRLAGIAVVALGLASPAFDHPPDLLISADSRLIAVRTPGGAFLYRSQGEQRFIEDAWAQFWSVDGFMPMPDLGAEPGDAVVCQPDSCRLRPYLDRPVALLARVVEKGTIQDCTDVAVIVSSEPARGLCPRPYPALVDRFTTWRNGSAAIWLWQDGATVLTDRQARGNRPWVPPVPRPRAAAPPDLPLAAVDRPEAGREHE